MFKMKAIYAVVCLASCFLFAGCFDVEEKTNFKTADSGDYSISVDMGQMLAQLKMFGAADKLNELKDTRKDSVSHFKDFIEQDSLLTKQEKDAVRKGYVKMLLNEDKDEMRMLLAAPFANMQQLAIMRTTLFKMISGKMKPALAGMDNMAGSGFNLNMLDLTSLGFVLKVEKGTIAQTMNAAQLKTNLETDSLMQQVKQLAPLIGSSVTYKSMYSFPAPIKNYKAVNGTLSDDRRTIIIKNDFNELFDNPAAFEYTISY